MAKIKSFKKRFRDQLEEYIKDLDILHNPSNTSGAEDVEENENLNKLQPISVMPIIADKEAKKFLFNIYEICPDASINLVLNTFNSKFRVCWRKKDIRLFKQFL